MLTLEDMFRLPVSLGWLLTAMVAGGVDARASFLDTVTLYGNEAPFGSISFLATVNGVANGVGSVVSVSVDLPANAQVGNPELIFGLADLQSFSIDFQAPPCPNPPQPGAPYAVCYNTITFEFAPPVGITLNPLSGGTYPGRSLFGQATTEYRGDTPASGVANLGFAPFPPGATEDLGVVLSSSIPVGTPEPAAAILVLLGLIIGGICLRTRPARNQRSTSP